MYELEVVGYFRRDYVDGMSVEMRVSLKPMHKEWPSKRQGQNQSAKKWKR